MASDSGAPELPERAVAGPHGAVTAEYQGIGGLLSQRTWQRWTLSSFLARLPITMALFGLVLAGHAETGSLATGARLAGVTTFCAWPALCAAGCSTGESSAEDSSETAFSPAACSPRLPSA